MTASGIQESHPEILNQEDEELAREVDAAIPDPQPEFPPISADAIINKIKHDRTPLPGMAGRALGTLRDHEISMCIKRAAVKAGLPESRHYPVGVWGALEARSIQLVKDPTFVQRTEELLLGFQRGWSCQSLARVVIYWAFMQATTEILLQGR